MNTDTNDRLLRVCAGGPSRRTLFAIASGGLLAALATRLGSNEAAAKNKGKRRRTRKQRGRHQKRKQRQPLPPPPAPIARLDATCAVADDGDVSGSDADDRLAQTFTALASGPLVRADLRLRRGIGEFGDYVLRLSAVDGAGVPTNVVLAESSLPDGTVPEGVSEVAFTFPAPFPVVAGTSYALVLARPAGNRFNWRLRGDNPCPGAGFQSTGPTEPFLEATNGDFIFTTFVSS
jgi:hypothetical protein